MARKNNFWSRLTGSQKRESGSDDQAKTGPRYGADPGLVLVGGPAQALQVAAVYRCVQVIGSAVASLPVEYQKRDRDGVFRRDASHLNYLLSIQPSEDCNAPDFWDCALRQVLLCGYAVIVPVPDPVTPGDWSRLVLCAPGTVSYDDLNGIYTINDVQAGVAGVFREDEVIHLKGLSLDGRHGLSVLSFAQATLGIAATGDLETQNRFANGGNIRGIVGNDTSVRGFGDYQDEELRRTAVDLDKRFRSGERIVNLPGQAKFSQISLSSVDMEFLNTRKFTVREICRFFGVPPTFVFDDTSNNYKSAEMANTAFLAQTLNPILVRIEAELQRKLVPAYRSDRYRFRFDRRGLYAADLETLAGYQTQTIASGVYTINDWRRYENKPLVEGGDRPLVSANLKSLDELLRPSGAPAQTDNASNEPTEN